MYFTCGGDTREEWDTLAGLSCSGNPKARDRRGPFDCTQGRRLSYGGSCFAARFGLEFAAMTGLQMAAHPFPVARWLALVWLVLWVPTYVRQWGWSNFVFLCDMAVILTCVGLWFGNALLLSSQAVSAIVINLIWVLDVAWRAAYGKHLLGGTEYMFDSRFPVWIRLISLFHLVWPFLVVWAVRCVGYDRRALLLQSGIAAVVMVAARFVPAERNINFAHRDPFFGWSWGPAPAHLALMLAVLIAVVYWPTHALLARFIPPPAQK